MKTTSSKFKITVLLLNEVRFRCLYVDHDLLNEDLSGNFNRLLDSDTPLSTAPVSKLSKRFYSSNESIVRGGKSDSGESCLF